MEGKAGVLARARLSGGEKYEALRTTLKNMVPSYTLCTESTVDRASPPKRRRLPNEDAVARGHLERPDGATDGRHVHQVVA